MASQVRGGNYCASFILNHLAPRSPLCHVRGCTGTGELRDVLCYTVEEREAAEAGFVSYSTALLRPIAYKDVKAAIYGVEGEARVPFVGVQASWFFYE